MPPKIPTGIPGGPAGRPGTIGYRRDDSLAPMTRGMRGQVGQISQYEARMNVG